MNPTHYFVDNRGVKVLGRVVGYGPYNYTLFLCLCNDGETWMKEPVCVLGVIKI